MKFCVAFLLKLIISGLLLAMTTWSQTESVWRIHTIAGDGKPGRGGDGGTAVEAQLDLPVGLAVDKAGNVYIADHYSQRVRRVDTAGTIDTVAGTGDPGYGGDGRPALLAQLNFPSGVAVDMAGNLYIADSGNDPRSPSGPFWNHHHDCWDWGVWLRLGRPSGRGTTGLSH